jgi:hypothetical protein
MTHEPKLQILRIRLEETTFCSVLRSADFGSLIELCIGVSSTTTFETYDDFSETFSPFLRRIFNDDLSANLVVDNGKNEDAITFQLYRTDASSDRPPFTVKSTVFGSGWAQMFLNGFRPRQVTLVNVWNERWECMQMSNLFQRCVDWQSIFSETQQLVICDSYLGGALVDSLKLIMSQGSRKFQALYIVNCKYVQAAFIDDVRHVTNYVLWDGLGGTTNEDY